MIHFMEQHRFFCVKSKTSESIVVTKQRVIKQCLIRQGRMSAQFSRTSCPLPGNRPSPSRPSSNAMADRKSTRLNSSHRTISYAVFCLKKKKKKIIEEQQYDRQERRTYEL